ncbi:histone-lysine N-methyltransferase SETD8-A [Elysia marginata]|uniref:Histone-lysine N-methyltransferase SETD8-A n=1 Tax=Elysia marginata TaxID=1093978 RepID=A0AAV4HIE2_9GAST|nr:histone-lysine N-methyltransferase SETD8-A [Elysia marginata]
MEKHLLENLKLAYQSGKGSRKMVPVLITEDTVELITTLLYERNNCQISEDNVYLFPNTGASLDHASGYHCLKSIVFICPSLKKPNLLIADKFRHRVSTMFAQLDLPDEQRQIFYSHMGHSETINKNVYQCPLAVREVTQVGKFLLNNDNNGYLTNAENGHQGSLDQVNRSENDKQITVDESDMPLNERGGKAGEEVVQIDAECTIEVIQSGSQTRNIEKKSGRNYSKWKETESNLFKKQFKDYITDTTNDGRLPGKHEVLKFLEEVSILEGHKNKVHLVKTKIFNEKKKHRDGKFKKV